MSLIIWFSLGLVYMASGHSHEHTICGCNDLQDCMRGRQNYTAKKECIKSCVSTAEVEEVIETCKPWTEEEQLMWKEKKLEKKEMCKKKQLCVLETTGTCDPKPKIAERFRRSDEDQSEEESNESEDEVVEEQKRKKGCPWTKLLRAIGDDALQTCIDTCEESHKKPEDKELRDSCAAELDCTVRPIDAAVESDAKAKCKKEIMGERSEEDKAKKWEEKKEKMIQWCSCVADDLGDKFTGDCEEMYQKAE